MNWNTLLLSALFFLLLSSCCQLKGLMPSPKPRCQPGERLVKITDEACEGKGYLKDVACGTCSGSGVVWVERGYNAAMGVTYVSPSRCNDCCGSGKKIHPMCNGKGWVWSCKPIN